MSEADLYEAILAQRGERGEVNEESAARFR
jgi:hypothetical protein